MTRPSLFFLLFLILVTPAIVSGTINVKGTSRPATDISVDTTKHGKEESPALDGKILGGNRAFPGQFPHQVSLKRAYSKLHFCGGSLISVNVVLTAAHCMFIGKGKALIAPWSIRVVAGVLQLSENYNSKHERRVTKFTIHNKFNSYTYEQDIAVLFLDTPFGISHTIRPIPLRYTAPVFPETICEVAGWGYTKYNGSVSIDLLYVELPIIPRRICQALLYNFTYVNEGQLCAGYYNGGKDTCQGDSGGGLICNGQLAGVVSAGFECGLPKTPGLYTNVAYYRPWILQNVALAAQSLSKQSVINSASSTPHITSLVFILSPFLLFI